MTVPFIGPEAEEKLDWLALTDALAAGHRLPKAEVGDTFLYRGADTVLSRAAWIDGLGQLVKTATIFPGNPSQDLPLIHGAVSVFSDETGQLAAMVDFHLLTKWKTAGDSLLAARRLARPESETVLIVGAGTVGRSLRQAYGALFPKARFQIWNRTFDRAAELAAAFERTEAVSDLQAAVNEADVITSATMSTEPLIDGAWLRTGQHIDLIGAYRPDMRETNDAALTAASIFVDSRATTLHHIGELKRPLEAGVITEADVVADYYDLENGGFARAAEDQITLFKNGGGAHLDLMTARYILDVVQGG